MQPLPAGDKAKNRQTPLPTSRQSAVDHEDSSQHLKQVAIGDPSIDARIVGGSGADATLSARE